MFVDFFGKFFSLTLALSLGERGLFLRFFLLSSAFFLVKFFTFFMVFVFCKF